MRGAKLTSDLPILQQTATGVWKKEDELRDLKGEVAALERKIALSLKPVDQSSEQSQNEGDRLQQTPSQEQNHQDEILPSSLLNDQVLVARMKM